jgi:hypothetical protein
MTAGEAGLDDEQIRETKPVEIALGDVGGCVSLVWLGDLCD